MGEKAIIPFDEDNSRFIHENGVWFVDCQHFKGRGNRAKILIAKTSNPYYDVVENLVGFPFYIVRENDKWFIYVSVSVNKNINGNVIGVDFNMRKWVASPYEGKPLFFDATGYSKEVARLQKLISKTQSKGRSVDVFYHKLEGVVKRAHGNFLTQIEKTWGICTLNIENIATMFKLTNKGSTLINNWLYRRTALRKFVLRAMAKGFNVVEVNPKDTSQNCHRCGFKGIIYGKHQRLFRCLNCGLKDYNRDLNSARNIARLSSFI
jgi:transposase